MRVFCAMSGGVDSSAAALLLQRMGYTVEGVTMHLFKDGVFMCGDSSVDAAQKICTQLKIPFHMVDFSDIFSQNVIEPFALAYAGALTPNPCVDCNKHLKFGALLDYTLSLGADKLATGHYARIEEKHGIYSLKKSPVRQKDQSYVLWTLTQAQLSHILFPVGSMEKSEVRAAAAQLGLDSAEKKDSQDICFVPDGDYRAFLTHFNGHPFKEGLFIDTKGNVIGTNSGIEAYTVGQRRGLGISSDERLYVLSKNAMENTITLGKKDQLRTRSLELRDINIILPDTKHSFSCSVQVRYNGKETPALVETFSDMTGRISFHEDIYGHCPGQSAVFYDADTVIGGGVIT